MDRFGLLCRSIYEDKNITGYKLDYVDTDSITITENSAVTTTRNDVNVIVTEYGIAQLKGKTLKERARALINIAHPNFREELAKEYERRFNEKF